MRGKREQERHLRTKIPALQGRLEKGRLKLESENESARIET